MTLPNLNFPQIQQGPVLQDPGLGGTLASSLAGVLAAMQEREKLDMEQKDFESKQAYFKTLKEGNELENEQKRSGLKKEQRALEAKGAGLNAYSQWVGSGARQDSLGAILAKIKDPDTAQDFVDRVTKHREQENQAALAAKNTADAKVATETTDEKIAQAGTDAATSAIDARVAGATETDRVANAKATRQKSQADAKVAMAEANGPPKTGVDPNVANAATNLGRTFGLPIGQAFSTVGGTLPPGVDPATVPQLAGGMGGADKRRNQVTTTAAKAADQIINQLSNRGVKLSRYSSLLTSTKLGEMVLPDDEQQLLQANRQFAQMYGLFVTGQASSEPELQRILKTVTEVGTDKPGVKQQKAILRQVILQAMSSAYGEGKPTSEVLQAATEHARSLGIGTEGVKFLNNSFMQARNAEITTEKDAAKAPVVAPSTSWQPTDYDSLMGAYNWGAR